MPALPDLPGSVASSQRTTREAGRLLRSHTGLASRHVHAVVGDLGVARRRSRGLGILVVVGALNHHVGHLGWEDGNGKDQGGGGGSDDDDLGELHYLIIGGDWVLAEDA